MRTVLNKTLSTSRGKFKSGRRTTGGICSAKIGTSTLFSSVHDSRAFSVREASSANNSLCICIYCREETQLLYLTYAEQHVERYGISYFSIENFKGTKLLLGIDSSGINVYRPSDKYDPSALPICPQPSFSLVGTSRSAPEHYPHMRRILSTVLYCTVHSTCGTYCRLTVREQ